MKRRISTLILISVLLAGCHGKVNLSAAKADYLRGLAGRTKTVYAPAFINVVALLKQQPNLTQENLALLQHASDAADKFKLYAEPLANLIISVASIDLADKVALKAALEDLRAAWNQLSPLISELNAKIASALTDNEIVRAGLIVAPAGVDLFIGLVQSRVQ